MTKMKLVIVMGVSGSGKSTVAQQLANDIGANYLDADDFHSDEARQQMANGEALTDKQREPWIARIITYLHEHKEVNGGFVLAYSGLKRAHRQLFMALPYSVRMFLLDASEPVIAERLKKRKDHFFDTSLLKTQFDSLERPNCSEGIIVVDANQQPQTLLSVIKNQL